MPAATGDGSEYPTRDAARARGEPAPTFGLRRGVPLPPLPRPRPRLPWSASARARVRRAADPRSGRSSTGIAVRLDVFQLAGLAVQTWFIAAVFVANLVALVYRAAAIVDAWRIARWLQTVRRAAPRGRAPRDRRDRAAGGRCAGRRPARHERRTRRRRPVRPAPRRHHGLHLRLRMRRGCGPTRTAAPDGSGAPIDETARHPTRARVGTPVPSVSIPPWDGKERLNILLIGADEQGGGHNTDTLITLSIDPATNQVAMFQLPRDTVDVPIPEGPARKLFGTVYAGKINSWFVAVRNRPDLYPGDGPDPWLQRPEGDPRGALRDPRSATTSRSTSRASSRSSTPSAGSPSTSRSRSSTIATRSAAARVQRVYIASGMQHMSGAEALVYARSRHGSTDFDRGRAPAAGPALAPPADRCRPRPAEGGRAGGRALGVRPDRHPARAAAAAPGPGRPGRHARRPLVHLHAEGLPDRVPVRARAATSSSPRWTGSGRPCATPSPRTRRWPTGASSSARRTPRSTS